MKTLSFSRKQLTQARLAASMTQDDLAFALRRVTRGDLKTNAQAISKWERGKHTPTSEAVAAIAAATGQEIGFFYEDNGNGEDDEEEAEPMLPASAVKALSRMSLDDILRLRARQVIDEEIARERTA